MNRKRSLRQAQRKSRTLVRNVQQSRESWKKPKRNSSRIKDCSKRLIIKMMLQNLRILKARNSLNHFSNRCPTLTKSYMILRPRTIISSNNSIRTTRRLLITKIWADDSIKLRKIEMLLRHSSIRDSSNSRISKQRLRIRRNHWMRPGKGINNSNNYRKTLRKVGNK
jgi:hypothetical protein